MAGETRSAQLEYSELQAQTKDVTKRQAKAAKIGAVLRDFLGPAGLVGARALDLGCSTGYTSAHLAESGASVIGLDIDGPGLRYAADLFGSEVSFACSDGSELPVRSRSVDVVVYNHVYEHVVDPVATMAEIRRVLRPEGVVYLGLGNRYGVMEPHYRLPFLSWLPRRAAHFYLRQARGTDRYHESLKSRSGLLELCRGLNVWDYTYAILAEPSRYAATDLLPAASAGLPAWLWKGLTPVIPTFIWVGSLSDRGPHRHERRAAPSRVLAAPATP